MPTLFCCILNCESESVNTKKRKIFYRLPQNSDRKQLWLNQIGDRIKYGTVSSNSRICNSHFATGKPNLDSSHIDYMPTIFPWSTKEEKMKSFKSVEDYESKIKELEQKILAKAFLNASSGSKLSQESSTAKFELAENEIYSKLIIDTDLSNIDNNNKHRSGKSSSKNNPNSEFNGIDHNKSNSLEKTIAIDSGNNPIFKDSCIHAHTNSHASQHTNQINSINQHTNQHTMLSNNINSNPSTIQLVPDNTVSIKSNLLNYLLSSISRVNIANNNAELAKSLSVNVSMTSNVGPLNLSQSYNKLDDQSVKKEKICEIEVNKTDQIKKEFVNQPNIDPSIDTGANFLQRKNTFNISQTPDRTTTPSEETTSRSCTCTKSSCLKLYCECFANGNLCCSGCTCINCRNNDNHKEERAKIVSSYLERDPWVFNSKIENKEVGKKHSKGCNCLKSSCLKNYCECFENKVFCSSLCRCRMCYNNEEHTQHNNRDDTKIYASSHTSESLSVLSENSPRDGNRKRKKSSIKANEIYEDVSSNESDEEVNAKRCQLEPETISLENDKRSNRSINSMEIPPVLPQEDDFTEEELALMVKFREQRSDKTSSNVKTECVSPPSQFQQPPTATTATISVQTANAITNTTSATSTPVINIPAHLDSNLLLTLSKSLAVANLGLNGLNVVNTTIHDAKRPSGIDLLSLLTTQQLMVSRQSTDVTNVNCIAVPQNCNHVIPINLTQMSPSCVTQIGQITSPVITQSRVITTSPTSVGTIISQSKPKLSTEDYVRKHIEAAERAVRADYMRKDSSTYKKPITKQKIKIDPFPLSSKPTQLNNIKPAIPNNLSNGELARVNSTIQPATIFTKFDDQMAISTNCQGLTQVVNGRLSNSIIDTTAAGGTTATTMSPNAVDTNQSIVHHNLALYNWVSLPNALTPHVNTSTSTNSVLHNVQMNCQSNTLIDNDSLVKVPITDCFVKDKQSNRNRNKSLRHSLQSLRTEIRSLKFHMRADQSRLRRLEKNMHILRNQIGK